MDSASFTYQGKIYQVDKVVELKPEKGRRCLRIITSENNQFKLTFIESIFKWVLTESTD